MRSWNRAVAKSRLSKKYRTTIPREVRDELGLEPGDVLLWEVVNGAARVRPAMRAFLARRGSIEVGPGSTVEDIRRARRERGKEGLSQLVEPAAAGEEIVPSQAGHPVARLAPIGSRSAQSRPGAWKGQVWMDEDFDAPLPLGFGVEDEDKA